MKFIPINNNVLVRLMDKPRVGSLSISAIENYEYGKIIRSDDKDLVGKDVIFPGGYCGGQRVYEDNVAHIIIEKKFITAFVE